MSPSRATLEFEAELATVLEESKATFEEEERKRQRRLLPERKACGLPKESKMLTRSLTQTFTELGRENANPRRQSRIVKDAEISLMALVVKRRERRKQNPPSESSECAAAAAELVPPPTLHSTAMRVEAALATLGVQVVDVGSRNTSENGEEMYNQCFYLSLAASWLAAISEGFIDLKESVDTIRDTALSLKRFIEGRVIEAHPEWVNTGHIGENIQAFSDFLPYAVCRPNTTRGPMDDLCIIVVSEVGQADVYIGRKFSDSKSDVVLIYHTPGHYQCILQPDGLPLRRRSVRRALDRWGVVVVETREV